ncbi:BgTH12-06627 [Blumeria graminis f. sp. triticale]|uniref:EKC/KEOPS complex subunit BUD32 n=1 Tax=Blumeria graminis f. sp. triticale TaxID=1689686 RepID=A0A9W4CYI2_BLUGR|nr:BgTH12-06627 [Blumeria graminis f. sp. triticale]
MTISDEDVQHFIEHPLEKITSLFRRYCDFENFKIDRENPNGDIDLTPISDLLLILLSSLGFYAQKRVAPSTIEKNMSGRLPSIHNRLESKAVNTSYFLPLVTSILFNCSDAVIWSHLTDLVDNLEPITPLQHDASSSHHPDAQHIYTTGQLKVADETMDMLKDALRKELMGTVFEDVTRFYEKFFEKPLWASKCQKISESYANRKDQESFIFPDDRTEANIWQWIKTIKGGPCFRQVDFFIKSRSLRRGTPHSWRDIQVLGEITKLPTSAWMDKFLQLAVYMREVFTAQPLRKFVHGFLLLDTKLQLWVFDRSGPYSTGFIDIGENPEVFVYVITAYMMMSDEELGIDTSVRHERGQTIITVTDANTQEPRILILEAEPFFAQRAIASRGTACYRALDGTYVVKISWRAVDRLSEVNLLMQTRDVGGVARQIGSRDDSKISELRKGLKITSEKAGPSIPAESNEHCTSEKRKDRAEDSIGDDGDRRSKRVCVSDIARVAQENTAVISDQGNGNQTGSGKVAPVKMGRHWTRISSGEPVKYFVQTRKSGRSGKSESSKSGSKRSRNPDRPQEKHSAVPERDLKRFRISSTARETVSGGGTAPISTQVGPLTSAPGDRTGDGAEATPTVVNDEDVDDTGTSELSIVYRNRQKIYIATKPHGRSIGEETTALELLQGIRDVILAHISLFKEVRILHRDVSINNIILTDTAVNNGRYGLLIDLDLAISLNDVNSEQNRQTMTGTMEYIALRILQANIYETGKGYKHTYRHDLESFFYVLVSACIRFGWGNKKSGHTDILSKWYTGTVQNMYLNKKEAVSHKYFKKCLLDHFSTRYDCVKALVTRLRIILFHRSTGVDTSTNPFADEVYDLILKAFDNEIKGIKLVEQLARSSKRRR